LALMVAADSSDMAAFLLFSFGSFRGSAEAFLFS